MPRPDIEIDAGIGYSQTESQRKTIEKDRVSILWGACKGFGHMFNPSRFLEASQEA